MFAVLPAPCDHWGLVEAGAEASPDKWGSFHSSESLEWARCILCNEVCNAEGRSWQRVFGIKPELIGNLSNGGYQGRPLG